MNPIPPASSSTPPWNTNGEKLAANPSGLLVYHPPGVKALTPGQLITEFLTEVVEALIVVFLLAQTKLTSFGSRVGFVILAGVLAAITTNIPYWNWYGFPGSYTAAYMTIEIVGYVVAGIVNSADHEEQHSQGLGDRSLGRAQSP